MNERQKIDISTTSLIKFFGIILGIFFIYFIRDILVLLFVVLIIVAALDPMVSWAEERKIPRAFSTVILYLILISFLALAIFSILPPIIDQISSLANDLPFYFRKISSFLNIHLFDFAGNWQDILNTISKELSTITNGFYNATVALFGGLTAAVTVLVLSFYLLLERQGAKKFFINIFPANKKEVFLDFFRKIVLKMGGWLRGQIIISLIIGLSVTVVLTAFGIPYALTIGLVAALVEIVPIIGPFISGTLAVLTTLLTGGWVQALIILAIFLAIQQAESHFLVPKVMEKAVGLSPVIIIIALLIGGKLAGIPGAILAIPFAAGLSVLFQEWPKLKN